MGSNLTLRSNLPLEFYLAGLQISRGVGQHMERENGMGCFDLIFVREGMLPIQEEQQAFEVGAGQTLLLWPHRRHWGTRQFSSDMKMYWLHFNIGDNGAHSKPRRFQQEQVLDVPQYTTVARPDVLESLFRRLLDDQATGRLLPHYGSLLVNLMLCEIADNRSVGTADRRGAVLAGRAMTYIRAHLNQPLSASLVADELGYNPEYLNRVFHQTYQHTITEEIHLSRMGYARYLLLHSSQSIKEIAVSCGFNDVNYFSRLFKRYEGMTAMTFRRLHAQAEINYE
ncbi:AraC family transcriptional regulator [bacterium]|nr:MAG: AraC family transcriptional regulator [bacterium]